jgi:Zn-dependent protease with chaperone function
LIVPYELRLLCLCLASFFLIHLALSVFASALAPWAMRRAELIGERQPARSAAMLLLAVRLFPAVLTLATVAALCLPSFLSFERERGAEAAGIPFLAAAALGASIWTISLMRGVRAVIHSHRCVSRRSAVVESESETFWLWEGAAPVIGLAGVLRPRVVVSRSVVSALEGEQLAAALRHERAHRASGDNLKRLLLLLAPDALPCVSLFRPVDLAWARFAEWAADDRAVAEDVDRSIALAEALVRVARLGIAPRTSPLMSAFVPPGEDISTRVDRLLNGASYAGGHSRFFGSALFASLFAVPFAIVAVAPGSLSAVHQLLERLMH